MGYESLIKMGYIQISKEDVIANNLELCDRDFFTLTDRLLPMDYLEDYINELDHRIDNVEMVSYYADDDDNTFFTIEEINTRDYVRD